MQLNDTQLAQVDAQIKKLISGDNYYGRKYKELNITGVSSQEEFENLPFSSKDDLRNAYPLGIQAVPDEEVVRIHSSSGTTGKPVIIPYTAKDVDDWATMFARCYATAGITKKDRIQITPGYGLWTAGIGFQLGCEKLGAMAIPMGPGNTDKQLQMMVDLQSTVITATSSYALLLSEEIEKRGLKDKICLKKGVIGSERWSDKMRKSIRDGLGIELYDIYGLTEIYGRASRQSIIGMIIFILRSSIRRLARPCRTEKRAKLLSQHSSRRALRLSVSVHMIFRALYRPAATVSDARNIRESISSRVEAMTCSRYTALICSRARLRNFSLRWTVYPASTTSTSHTMMRSTKMSCLSPARQKDASASRKPRNICMNCLSQELVSHRESQLFRSEHCRVRRKRRSA